jgi:hypothetical protein
MHSFIIAIEHGDSLLPFCYRSVLLLTKKHGDFFHSGIDLAAGGDFTMGRL